MTEPVLRLEGVVKRYGGALGVGPVDFAVERGEFLTMLGPSGCGKTTTLHIIAGLLEPTGGRLFMAGRDITGLEQPSGGSIVLDGATVYSATARRNLATEKRGVSMVFQSYAIWPHMNVFENVAYGLRVRKLPRAEIDRQVERALGHVERHVLHGVDRTAAVIGVFGEQ